MISNLDNFDPGKNSEIHVYVHGIEIDKIPELAEICKLDKWMDAFMEWARRKYPTGTMYAIFDRPLEKRDVYGEALLQEVYLGELPPGKDLGDRVMELTPKGFTG